MREDQALTGGDLALILGTLEECPSALVGLRVRLLSAPQPSCRQQPSNASRLNVLEALQYE
jgi:hypothetical protein